MEESFVMAALTGNQRWDCEQSKAGSGQRFVHRNVHQGMAGSEDTEDTEEPVPRHSERTSQRLEMAMVTV